MNSKKSLIPVRLSLNASRSIQCCARSSRGFRQGTHYRTKVHDFLPGWDSWCVIVMSEHGTGDRGKVGSDADCRTRKTKPQAQLKHKEHRVGRRSEFASHTVFSRPRSAAWTTWVGRCLPCRKPAYSYFRLVLDRATRRVHKTRGSPSIRIAVPHGLLEYSKHRLGQRSSNFTSKNRKTGLLS
jgi:hypothetical protein